jgi:ComF family protein
MKKLLQPVHDLFNVVFPNICSCCSNTLSTTEKEVCYNCIDKLPLTNFYKDRDNTVAQKFWGRIKLESAAAFYFQNKENITQQLIHQLKYKHKTNIGLKLGEIMGHYLSQPDSIFKDIDIIIPLPLHITKQRIRGYNQCDFIAEGLSSVLQKPFATDVVKRAIANESQTKKNKFQRWENVDGIFELANKEKIKNKHLLLIDDVVTTGSTIEACANALLKEPSIKLSVLTVAFPQD